MKKENIILILIAVLILTAGVFFGLWRKNKTEIEKLEKEITNIREQEMKPEKSNQRRDGINTNDWKIYKNEEYGFEMEIPSDWIKNWTFNQEQKEAMKRETDLVVTFVSGDIEERKKNKQIDYAYIWDLSIRIWETFNDNPEVVGNRLEVDTPEEFFEKNPLVKKISEFKIDGNKAYKYIQGGGLGASDGDNSVILIEANNRYYSVKFDRPVYEGAEEIRDHIISTIKFF